MLSRWSQIAAENTPWVDSLTATDPVVFPLIFLVSSLANIQINSMRKLSVPQTTLQIAIPWILRTAVTGIAIFAMFTPSVSSFPRFPASALDLLSSDSTGRDNVLGNLEFISAIVKLVPED